MEVIQSGGKPIKVWTDISQIESQAIQQLERISIMPFIYDHVPVIPDVHLGKATTVGSVIATKGAIMPANNLLFFYAYTINYHSNIKMI